MLGDDTRHQQKHAVAFQPHDSASDRRPRISVARRFGGRVHPLGRAAKGFELRGLLGGLLARELLERRVKLGARERPGLRQPKNQELLEPSVHALDERVEGTFARALQQASPLGSLPVPAQSSQTSVRPAMRLSSKASAGACVTWSATRASASCAGPDPA